MFRPFGGGGTGSSSATTSPFGSINNPLGGSNPNYSITTETDGINTVNMISITAMSAFRNRNFEEIRLEDYSRGRKGPTNANVFQASKPFGTNISSSSSSSTFNNPSNTPFGGSNSSTFNQSSSTPSLMGMPTGTTNPTNPTTNIFGQSTSLLASSNPPSTGFGQFKPAIPSTLNTLSSLSGASPSSISNTPFGIPTGTLAGSSSGGLFGQSNINPISSFSNQQFSTSSLPVGGGVSGSIPSTGASGLFGQSATSNMTPSMPFASGSLASPSSSGLFSNPSISNPSSSITSTTTNTFPSSSLSFGGVATSTTNSIPNPQTNNLFGQSQSLPFTFQSSSSSIPTTSSNFPFGNTGNVSGSNSAMTNANATGGLFNQSNLNFGNTSGNAPFNTLPPSPSTATSNSNIAFPMKSSSGGLFGQSPLSVNQSFIPTGDGIGMGSSGTGTGTGGMFGTTGMTNQSINSSSLFPSRPFLSPNSNSISNSGIANSNLNATGTLGMGSSGTGGMFGSGIPGSSSLMTAPPSLPSGGLFGATGGVGTGIMTPSLNSSISNANATGISGTLGMGSSGTGLYGQSMGMGTLPSRSSNFGPESAGSFNLNANSNLNGISGMVGSGMNASSPSSLPASQLPLNSLLTSQTGTVTNNPLFGNSGIGIGIGNASQLPSSIPSGASGGVGVGGSGGIGFNFQLPSATSSIGRGVGMGNSFPLQGTGNSIQSLPTTIVNPLAPPIPLLNSSQAIAPQSQSLISNSNPSSSSLTILSSSNLSREGMEKTLSSSNAISPSTDIISKLLFPPPVSFRASNSKSNSNFKSGNSSNISHFNSISNSSSVSLMSNSTSFNPQRKERAKEREREREEGKLTRISTPGLIIPRKSNVKQLIITKEQEDQERIERGREGEVGIRIKNNYKSKSFDPDGDSNSFISINERKEGKGIGIEGECKSQFSYQDCYTIPNEEALKRMPYSQLSSIDDFIVGKRGVGQIKFLVPVNLTCIAYDDILCKIVIFKSSEIIVYPDEDTKPPVGQGLNLPAECQLERCWPINKSTREPILNMQDDRMKFHIERLKSISDTMFLDYLPESGTWIFKVEHFSSYKFQLESESESESEPKMESKIETNIGIEPKIEMEPENQIESKIENEKIKTLPFLLSLNNSNHYNSSFSCDL